MIEQPTTYHVDTPRQVINILESARCGGYRLRLFYGDVETGCDWMEEYETIGRIGRSTGAVKVPLLIKTSRSLGGGAILDHCIVRITRAGHDLYRHPLYHAPFLFATEYGTVTDEDGSVRARFKTHAQAVRYCQFMAGERNSK